MRIRIYVHPKEKNVFWAKQTKKALSAECLRRRYTAEYIDAPSVKDIDFDAVYSGEEKRILLYIGIQHPKDLNYLSAHNVHTILINNDFSQFSSHHSRVLINYQSALEKAIGYLLANKRSRIALYGINLASPTDRIMEQRFSDYLRLGDEEPNRDIYYNHSFISDCYARFAPYRTAYNAVICANDITAVDLRHRLEADGTRVPEEVYIISCGLSSILVDQPDTSITSVSANRDEIGAQAVYIYSVLMKATQSLALTAQVEPTLTVRASTAFAPIPETEFHLPHVAHTPAASFYEDPITQNFFNVENLLLHYDDLDRGILAGIFSGETYSVIAERLYTTENMISFRVKRMCRLAGCSGRKALVALLAPYLK